MLLKPRQLGRTEYVEGVTAITNASASGSVNASAERKGPKSVRLSASRDPIAQSRSLAGEPTDARDRRTLNHETRAGTTFRAFALALAAFRRYPHWRSRRS